MDIVDQVVRLTMEVERLRRMIPRMMRYGTVAEVDTARARARLLISDPDADKPFLSPWVPWAEAAGQTKTWRPPSVGQQMVFISAGDPRRGMLVPATFSDEAASPSSDGDANREVIGSVTIDAGADFYKVTAPRIDLGAAGGRAVARIGDKVTTPLGEGDIISGSSKVFAAD